MDHYTPTVHSKFPLIPNENLKSNFMQSLLVLRNKPRSIRNLAITESSLARKYDTTKCWETTDVKESLSGPFSRATKTVFCFLNTKKRTRNTHQSKMRRLLMLPLHPHSPQMQKTLVNKQKDIIHERSCHGPSQCSSALQRACFRAGIGVYVYAHGAGLKGG